MITDPIQLAMASAQFPIVQQVSHRRKVESVEKLGRDGEAMPDAAFLLRGAPGEAPTVTALHTRKDALRFVYEAVTQNGRRGAKRTPQVTDTRYWSCIFDRVG